MNATPTPTIADRKRPRHRPRTLLNRYFDRMKRQGGVPTDADGCLCYPSWRRRAHHNAAHWVAARDPRDGKLVWSWITLRAGLNLNPHDLTADELTRALEVWVVREDVRKHSELPASEAVNA